VSTQTHRVFVRKRKDDQFPIVRIYFTEPLSLIEEEIRIFQDEIAEMVTAGFVQVRLHEFFVAIQWVRLETKRENDIVQEALVSGFITFLQARLNWQDVAREDFEFAQLNAVARREDRLWEWHPSG